MEFFWLLGSRARSAATSQKEKRAKGDDRKVWHKIIETDGTTIEGVGTLSEKIVAGSGKLLIGKNSVVLSLMTKHQK